MNSQADEDLTDLAKYTDGWDGEGALGALPATVDNARTLLRIIRPTEPDVTLNNNGTFDIEWDDGARRVLLEVGRTRFAGYVTEPGEPTHYLDGGIRTAGDTP